MTQNMHDLTVLVVDDQPEHRMLVRQTLERRGIASSNILEADAYEPAVNLLLDNARINFVVTDCEYPDKSNDLLNQEVDKGVRLIEAIRSGAFEVAADIPIIIHSGRKDFPFRPEQFLGDERAVFYRKAGTGKASSLVWEKHLEDAVGYLLPLEHVGKHVATYDVEQQNLTPEMLRK